MIGLRRVILHTYADFPVLNDKPRKVNAGVGLDQLQVNFKLKLYDPSKHVTLQQMVRN